ncbi:hypothetical protein ACQKWADRAFT_286141 [Trichoderma austrokoningii]
MNLPRIEDRLLRALAMAFRTRITDMKINPYSMIHVRGYAYMVARVVLMDYSTLAFCKTGSWHGALIGTILGYCFCCILSNGKPKGRNLYRRCIQKRLLD